MTVARAFSCDPTEVAQWPLAVWNAAVELLEDENRALRKARRG